MKCSSKDICTLQVERSSSKTGYHEPRALRVHRVLGNVPYGTSVEWELIFPHGCAERSYVVLLGALRVWN